MDALERTLTQSRGGADEADAQARVRAARARRAAPRRRALGGAAARGRRRAATTSRAGNGRGHGRTQRLRRGRHQEPAAAEATIIGAARAYGAATPRATRGAHAARGRAGARGRADATTRRAGGARTAGTELLPWRRSWRRRGSQVVAARGGRRSPLGARRSRCRGRRRDRVHDFAGGEIPPPRAETTPKRRPARAARSRRPSRPDPDADATETPTADRQEPTTEPTPEPTETATPEPTAAAPSGSPMRSRRRATRRWPTATSTARSPISKPRSTRAETPREVDPCAYAMYDYGDALLRAGRPQESVQILEARLARFDNQNGRSARC